MTTEGVHLVCYSVLYFGIGRAICVCCGEVWFCVSDSYFFFLVCIFFFFKQKTAYEMRISDWSSDVCSSDLMTFPPSCGALCFLPLFPRRVRPGEGDLPEASPSSSAGSTRRRLSPGPQDCPHSGIQYIECQDSTNEIVNKIRALDGIKKLYSNFCTTSPRRFARDRSCRSPAPACRHRGLDARTARFHSESVHVFCISPTMAAPGRGQAICRKRQEATEKDDRSQAERSTAGYRRELPHPGLSGAEAGDHGDGHLRPSGRDPSGRTSAQRAPGRQPDADPRRADPPGDGRLRPVAAAPRQLRRPPEH